jgi:single-strand DNA-binding protein
MNSVILVGRTTKDIELRQSTTGVSLVQFSIAVPKAFSKESDFFNCIAWRATAEFLAKYVKKGTLVCVNGRLETRSYQAKDGTNKTVVEVVCGSVEALQRPSGSTNSNESEETTEDAPSENDIDDIF